MLLIDGSGVKKTDGTGMSKADNESLRDSDFCLLINMQYYDVGFDLPPVDTRKKWKRIIDTAFWAEKVSNNIWDINKADTIDYYYMVKAYSIVVLQAN